MNANWQRSCSIPPSIRVHSCPFAVKKSSQTCAILPDSSAERRKEASPFHVLCDLCASAFNLWTLAFFLCTLLASTVARAGSIETFNGDVFTGKVELDYGGVTFRPEKGAVVKIELGTVYRVLFDGAGPEQFTPGVVLRNGVRLAAPWGPFNDPVIKFPRRNLILPADEIAWIVYTPFPAELAANVPGGQTGVLLPKGDFFAGTIKGADADAAKISNPIFGPRTFAAGDIHALVLRDTHVPQASYEVRTADGSLFAADILTPSAAESSSSTRFTITSWSAPGRSSKFAPAPTAAVRSPPSPSCTLSPPMPCTCSPTAVSPSPQNPWPTA